MNKDKIYRTKNHCCFLLQYHLVIVSKYRRKVMVGDCREGMISLIQDFFESREELLIALEVCSDHVHILFEGTPKTSISSFVCELKSWTSRNIRTRYKEHVSKFYWKPFFWSGSYFVCTVSERSEEVVKQYILNQKVT